MSRAHADAAFSRCGRPLACLSLFLWLAALPLLPQTAPSRPGRAHDPESAAAADSYRIAGTMVNAATGEPVRRATVAVLAEADGHIVESVESDSEGRFSLERLSTAKYQLTASKRGFRTAFYDEHEEFSTAIVTGPGQDTVHLAFRLTPTAVLRGVVSADGGDPVDAARVMLFKRPQQHRLGERTTLVNTVNTDDTGAYEFSNLAAGEYLLAVTAEPWYALHSAGSRSQANQGNEASAALDVAYPVTYYDSTTDESSATPIILAGGSREEADINLHAVPALHLSIQAPRKPDGSIARPEMRQMIFGTQFSAESAGFLDALQTGATGFSSMAPGRYELIQGDPPRIADLDLAESQQVDPDAGTPAVTISGTLRTANGAALPDEVNLTLNLLDGGHGQGELETVAHKGRFRFETVPPGRWAVWAENSGKALPVVSTAANSAFQTGNLISVRDRPLGVVVTLSKGETRIEGFARKEGKGFAGAMVVLAPKDVATWQALIRRDQSDSDGSFALRDVAPGEYTVVAIENGWDLDWSRPGAMAQYLEGGTAITVSDRSGALARLAQPVTVQPR